MKDKENNIVNIVPAYAKMMDDITKVRQPENSYTYALNATVRNSILSREEGFSLQSSLPDGYVLISSSRLLNNRKVCFSTNENLKLDQIGIYDGITYTPVVTANLNLKLTHKIDCTYRLRNGCEDCIYFTDYLNPVRYFNFSRLENFKTNGNWNVNKFNLVRDAKFPKINNIRVADSGTPVKAGAVIFGIRYLDDDLNPTHFIYTTHSILLYKGNGAPSITYDSQYVGKTITFNITELDNDFKYYQIAVAYINGGTGNISEVKLTDKINISNTQFVYNSSTVFIESSIPELVAFKTAVSTALTVDQIDNQLILGNIKEASIDAAAHQKYASKIGVGAAFKNVNKHAVDSSYHPENPNYLEFASHMANEVIALAITYVDSTTGKESGPYHIPGRPLDTNPYYCDTLDIINGQDSITLNCTNVSFITSNTPNTIVKIAYVILDNGIVSTIDNVLLDLNNTEQETISFDKCVTAPKTISITSVTLVADGSNYPEELYTVEYQQKTTTNHYNTITLDGWDSTVYTIGERDVVALGNQYSYNEVLRAYFTFYGSDIALSDENLNRTTFKDYFKLKILEGVYTYPLKWEIYNTAKVVDNGKIIMGYYETKSSYYENPIHSNCLEEDYWGYDICGNSLTNKRIRHHRLPDRTLIPISNKTDITLIGMEFFNIEYPEEYDSHYFSCAVKTDNDKTVLDNGIVTRQLKVSPELNKWLSPAAHITENFEGSCYIYNYAKIKPLGSPLPNPPIDLFGSVDTAGYYSPASLANKFIPQGYLKYYYGFKNIPSNPTNPFVIDIDTHRLEFQEASKLYGADDTELVWFKANVERDDFAAVATDQPVNLPISRTFNIPVAGFEYDSLDGFKIVNRSLANRLVYLKGLERDLFKHSFIGYTSIMVNKDVYSNLDVITYRRLHINNLTKDDIQIVFGGDTYICKFNLVNYCKYSYIGDSIGVIVSALGAALNAAAATITTGNPLVTAGAGAAALIAGLTQLGIGDTLENKYNELVNHFAHNAFGTDGGDGVIKFLCEILEGVYIDSYINFNLRFDGNDSCTKVLRPFTTSTNAISAHLTNKFFKPAESDEEKKEAPDSGTVLRTMICPETYFYYDDFSPTLYAKRYYGVPSTYNYCSQCRELYPNRLYYSLQSFQEELTDNYKQILPNNYQDVQSEFGEIIDVFRSNNQLFVSLKESLLEQPRNLQERITDELVTFIGTGEFLSIPAREVLSAEAGKLGNTNKEATVVVPEGILIVDELNLKIFLLHEKEFKNLCSEEYGYKETLEKIIPIQLNKYFPDIDIKTNSHYCGYLCTYDEILKRFLITKKDFIPKSDYGIEYIDDKFVINVTTTTTTTNTPGTCDCEELSINIVQETDSYGDLLVRLNFNGTVIGTIDGETFTKTAPIIIHEFKDTLVINKITSIVGACTYIDNISRTFTQNKCYKHNIYNEGDTPINITYNKCRGDKTATEIVNPGQSIQICTPEKTVLSDSLLLSSTLLGACSSVNQNTVLKLQGTRQCEESNDSTNTVNNYTVIDINDSKYFYNASWTLSFSILTNGFVGFHSYIPDNYLSFKNALHLQLADNKFWKAHNKNIYCNYFGKQYPHIIEFCANNQMVKHLYNVIRVAIITSIWDEDNQYFKNTNKYGFERLLVYNERQCSGYIDLQLKDEYTDEATSFYRTDSININHFRDIIDVNADVPMFINNHLVDYRYSNKILNELALKKTAEWYEQYYFKGKYLVVRLIIDNFEAVKFETDINLIFQLPFLKY